MLSRLNSYNSHLQELADLAIAAGATRAAVISTDEISTENRLAKLCRDPKCQNYGLSQSCPPHVSGPDGFKKYLKDKNHAIVVCIDLSTDILFSEQRTEVMRLLHEIVSYVEKSAIEMGFADSNGFAGSSCKKIFCGEYQNCNALSDTGQCRHPETARPSMSGYGINVSKLMTAAGWPSNMDSVTAKPGEKSMSWVAGLIVIG